MAVEIFKLFGSIFVNNDEANKSISKKVQHYLDDYEWEVQRDGG